MQTTFELSFAKITKQDLDGLEAEITTALRRKKKIKPKESIRLPDDYRQFLLDINGGVAFHEAFIGAYGKITLPDMLFYGYYPMRKGDHNGSNLSHQWYGCYEYLDYFEGQIVIPIIELFHYCQAVLVLTGPEKGTIYEYDESGYEDGEYVKKIANSFTELFNGADFGIESGEDFFFHRLLKKCIFLNDYQEWFDYLDSREFQPEELKDMLWKSVDLACLPSIQKLVQVCTFSHENFDLFWAKNLSIAEFMVKSMGVSVIQPIWRGYSPLAWAAHEGRFEVVKYLISQGADIHHINPKDGSTIMMAAEASLQTYKDQYYLNHEQKIENLNQIIAYLKSLT